MVGWGVAALKRGDLEAAESRLARARELYGDRPAPALWYWAATLAASDTDKLDTALARAKAGVEAHPSSAVLRNNYGVLLEASGDTAAAEVMLKAAYAEEPTLPQASKNLADLCYRAGRYDEAFESYERAAKLDPSAFKRRDHARAREGWTRATELNPGHQLARANLDMLEAAS
jgi:Tfp pilus assembly protein PilF